MNRLSLLLPFLLGCAHAQLPSVHPGFGSNSARLAVTNPDRSGGRVHFVEGVHGRRRATSVMQGFCRGPHRVTTERLLWVTAWGWAGAGPVTMALPTTGELVDPRFDRELAFECGPAPTGASL